MWGSLRFDQGTQRRQGRAGKSPVALSARLRRAPFQFRERAHVVLEGHVPKPELAVRRKRHYWRRYDRNDVENTGMLRHRDALRDAVDALLEDRELRRLHRRAARRHEARVATLLENPRYAKLRRNILIDHHRYMETGGRYVFEHEEIPDAA